MADRKQIVRQHHFDLPYLDDQFDELCSAVSSALGGPSSAASGEGTKTTVLEQPGPPGPIGPAGPTGKGTKGDPGEPGKDYEWPTLRNTSDHTFRLGEIFGFVESIPTLARAGTVEAVAISRGTAGKDHDLEYGPCGTQFTLIETGVTPQIGQTAYLSGTVPGAATNAEPGIVEEIGVFVGVRMADSDGALVALRAGGRDGIDGEDSTVPGPPGADSTVPGPPGVDGLDFQWDELTNTLGATIRLGMLFGIDGGQVALAQAGLVRCVGVALEQVVDGAPFEYKSFGQAFVVLELGIGGASLGDLVYLSETEAGAGTLTETSELIGEVVAASASTTWGLDERVLAVVDLSIGSQGIQGETGAAGTDGLDGWNPFLVKRPARIETVVCLGDSLTRWGHASIKDGLYDVDAIEWQSGTTLRYTMSGSPNLSAVVAGQTLQVVDAANALHNGYFEITAVSDGSDYIEVTNADVTDDTTDVSSGSTASAAVAEIYQARSLYGSFPYQLIALALDEPRMWGVRVYNEGFSGETAAGGVARYAAHVSAKNPDVVTLQYGTNDLVAARSMEDWLADMEALVQAVVADGATPILMTIPDSNLGTIGASIPTWNAALVDMAKQYNVLLYDWNGMLGEATTANPLFEVESNGTTVVHLSWAGNRETALGLFYLMQREALQGGGRRVQMWPYYATSHTTFYNQTLVGPGVASVYFLTDTLTTPARTVYVMYYLKRQMGCVDATSYKVAECSFTGSSIGLVSGRASEQGQIQCKLYRYNGATWDLISDETVDLYDPAVWFNEVVWQKHGLDMANYYVEVTLLNTKNASSGGYAFAYEGLVVGSDPRYRAYT